MVTPMPPAPLRTWKINALIGVGLPSALDTRHDGMFAASWIHLCELIEILSDSVRPFAGLYIFGFNFDDFAGREPPIS